jgi:hypothetical protein
MKQIKIVIVLVVISISSFAQTKVEKQVLELSKKKFQWMTRSQLDSLGVVLDDQLMFVHSNGWTETKKEFIDDIKSGKLKYTQIEVQEASIRMFDKTAVVIGKGKFQVILEGAPLDINLYYTEVYVYKNRKWLLASRHANRLP